MADLSTIIESSIDEEVKCMDTTDQLDGERKLDVTNPSTPRTYNFLLRLSRLLGGVATHSSFIHDVRRLMNQDAASMIRKSSIFGLREGNGRTNDKPSALPNEADLKKIVAKSHELLVSANTVFPITLFPDTVTVDRTKVTITRRDFFWSSEVMSIRIEDVLNVAANVGPLFGSLTIASRVMSTVDHFKINHFWRTDVIRLKHIIQGYVIAQHNKIDTAHLGKKELIETLIELGHDSIN